MNDRTKLKEIDGIPIYVTQKGKFEVDLKGTTHSFRSLRDAEKLAINQRTVLRCFMVEEGTIYEVLVAGWKKGASSYEWDFIDNLGNKIRTWRGPPLVWNDELIATIDDINAKIHALRLQRSALVEQGRKVAQGNVPEIT